MNQRLNRFSNHYAAALEKQLKQGPQADLQPALMLGRQAVALGLETLDLARIHEQVVLLLGLSEVGNAFTRLAGIFFNEANTPIEETHRTALQTKVHLGRLMAALERRTRKLAATHLQLKKGVVQRKAMQLDFAKRGKHQQKCLEESLSLQKHLRELTHRMIAAQEDERTKISRQLQDEIAQTLLGINVRLLNLKQESTSKTKRLENEIASTQRLVVTSARSVRQAGRKIGYP